MSTQSQLQRITTSSEEGISINPSISGNGRVVVFESSEDVAGAGGPEGFRAIRADVSNDPATHLQIAATRAPAAAISQDGSRIAFASRDNPLGTNNDANCEIFLYHSTKLVQVTNTQPSEPSTRMFDGNFSPSISDDGRFIAFSSNRDLAQQNPDGNLEIFIFDTADQTFTQLTNSVGVVRATDAKISGNGAHVAYIRDNGTVPSEHRDLVVQNRVGPPVTRVIAPEVKGPVMSYGRAISDDGERVVWSEETAPNATQVFLYDGRNNNGTRQITNLGSRATDVSLQPTISGDGSRIAFATRRSVAGMGSNSDSSVELYTFHIPSGTFGRITNVNSSAATAEVVSSLSDDGNLIVFNYPRVLSGAVNNNIFANNSEIYLSSTPATPGSGALTILNRASMGHEPSSVKSVAPSSVAVATGTSLAFQTVQAQPLREGTFPSTVGGTSVTVNGSQAQVFSVSPIEVHFQVPPSTELGSAEVVVTNSDGYQSRAIVSTLRSAPGVYTRSGDGLGEGMILNAETLTAGPFDPSGSNLRLLVFATGVENSGSVSATAGGRALAVNSIISLPAMPGLDEIEVLVPADLRGAGKVELVIRADGRDSNAVSVEFTGDPRRDIQINEFLADPPDGPAGDANHDGTRETSQDEFIELVNTTAHDIDISGYRILTRSTSSASDTLRHTFPAHTIVPACKAIVVFGGGAFDPHEVAFGTAEVLKASSGALALPNSAGVITLQTPDSTLASLVAYGGSTGLEAGDNQSLTHFPDITGGFAQHGPATNGARLFSPGTQTDGTPFNPCTPSVARIAFSPTASSIHVGQQQQFTARAFDAGGNELPDIIFTWQTSRPDVATTDQNGLVTGIGIGTSELRATGRGVTAEPANLIVSQPVPVLTSINLTPTKSTIDLGETQQLVAQAKDQFGQDLSGNIITFVSSDAGVANVESSSASSASGSATALVSGLKNGLAEIRAFSISGPTTITSAPASILVEPAAGQLLISEFRTRGPTGASDEFIEIYNPTNSLLFIGGLRIRASNGSGTTADRISIPTGTTLASGCHYLVANTSVPGYSNAVAPDQTFLTGLTDDGGLAITGSNGVRIIDAVGMSTGSAYKEGAQLAPLVNNVNQSYERKPGAAFGNGVDTNNNGLDFLSIKSTSNPENRFSNCLDLTSADLSITNLTSSGSLVIGSEITFSVRVFNNGAGPAQSVVVTDDLPAGLEFMTCAATAGGVCDGSGNNRTIVFPSLASGSDALVTLTARVNGPPGSIANTANVSAVTRDPSTANNSATAFAVIQAPLPELRIADVTSREGVSGTTSFVFTVSLSAPATADIHFDISTIPASATEVDYSSRNLTNQTISSGEQMYSFEVVVNGDALVEPDESFTVRVTDVSGALVKDGEAIGLILNDDTPDLVISQFYGGGGNSGAVFINDFVEIFNRGESIVDFSVTPFSVQYAGSSSNFGSKVDLSKGIMAPGHYFLVQLGGGANGAPLPAADAAGNIAMAATAGKLALVAGTASLPSVSCPGHGDAALFNPAHPFIVDFVGYGGSATCFEGAGPAPAPSSSNAGFRGAGGCIDTGNNATDFFLHEPSPRNAGSTTNDCAHPTPANLSIDDVSMSEGNAGSKIFTFMVMLSSPAAVDVTFDISTKDSTATSGDYVSRTLEHQLIPAGQQTYRFEVTINGDSTVEPNETFFVNIENVTGAVIVDAQAVGTIENDDLPTLSVNDVSITEGDYGEKQIELIVGLSAPSAAAVIFDIATQDDTARIANNDYQPKKLNNQTIPAGQTNYRFQVIVNGDLNVELDESFLIKLTNVLGAAVVDSEGSATILNDDVARLVISQVYAGGGNAGAEFSNDFVEIFNDGLTTVNFSDTPYSLQYAGSTSNFGSSKLDVTSGIILPGQYFLAQLGGSSSGPPLPAPDASGSFAMASTAGKIALVSGTASLSGSGCPLATTVADFVGYGVTATCFAGNGPAPAPNTNTSLFRKSGGCTQTKGNATDFFTYTPAPRNTRSPLNDCLSGPLPHLSITDVSLVEDNSGTKIFSFTLGLSAPARNSDVIFDIATQDGTATVTNNDYVAHVLTSQIIPAGQLTYKFDVVVNGDLVIEPDEFFYVNITNLSGATPQDAQGLGTILNDDIPSLSISDVSLTEGNSGTKVFNFAVRLSRPSVSAVTFDIATQDDSATRADHDYVGDIFTGQSIPAGQQLYNFAVLVNGDLNIEGNETFLVNLTNVSGATVSDSQAIGNILNDDTAALSIDDVAVKEGDSDSTIITFTVNSSLPSPAGGITFDIATQDNTATAGSGDYVSRRLNNQFLPTAETTYTFAVEVKGDLDPEADEKFFVNLLNVRGATVMVPQGVATIENDDAANLVISQFFGGGGNSGATFTNDFVEILNRGTTAVDFGATPYSIQYAGATANFGSNKVDLTSATILPGHYFLVRLSGGANGTPLPTPDASGSLVLAATAGKVALVLGTKSLTGSGCPISESIVDLVGYGATANCFAGLGPSAAPGSSTAAFRRDGGCSNSQNNAVDFLVNGPAPRNSASPTNNCVPGPPVDLRISDVTMFEGDSGAKVFSFTVDLSAPSPSTDISFDIATQNVAATTGNNDYVSRVLANQIIPAGHQSFTFDVIVNGDTVVEADEAFLVNLTNVTNAIVTDSQAVGTIINDDLPTLTIDDVTLVEGNTGTKVMAFTVSLSTPSLSNPVTFDIATADNTATVSNDDYLPRSLVAQSIPVGEKSYTFPVTINGDLEIEGDETFFANISNVRGAVVTDNHGIGTISNDDTPSLGINDVTVKEGDNGQTTASFTVTSSLPAPAGGIIFNIATEDGTATAGADYLSKTLLSQNIPAGKSSYIFSVTVNGDTLVEANETFGVKITFASGATILDNTSVGTIQNDDIPRIVISQLYGGGGNAGSPMNHDFVEIFNRGTTSVDLHGWSIQYNSASGTDTWSVTPLCPSGSCVLIPGNYFLVQESGTGVSNLPNANATGTISLATASGKLAIADTSTALSGACPAANLHIVDLLGYGGTVTTSDFCFEGAGPSPAPSSANAIFRKAGGCSDTNDNAADFLTANAVPRNLATSLHDCNAASVLTTVTISPSSVTIAAGETLQFSAQAWDQFAQPLGGVTISFLTNNANATVVSTSPTSSTGLATATIAGTGSGSVQILARADNGIITVNSLPAMLSIEPAAGQVLIGEFRTRGPSGASDEFIEIYNPTSSPVVISGLKLRASTSTGTAGDRVAIPSDTTLNPGCHYLFANNTPSTGYSGASIPDQTYTAAIADNGGLAITRSDNTVIDAVGMNSTSAYQEGAMLAALAGTSNQSYERRPGGALGNGVDTNNNISDFLLNSASSNPQNSSSGCINLNSADLSLTKSVDNSAPSVGDSVKFTIILNNAGPSAANGVTVQDVLPTGLTLVSASTDVGSYDSNTGLWSAGHLGVGAHVATLVVSASVSSMGVKTNTAEIVASDNVDVDSTPSNQNGGEDDQSSVTITPTAVLAADVSISETDSPDPVAIGNDIAYNIVVANAGPNLAANAGVVTSVPANTLFRSISTPAGWTCPTLPATGASGPINCSTAGLMPGSAVFTLVVRVSGAVADNTVISHSAVVNSNTPDSNTGNNSTSQTTIVEKPSLVITQIYPGGGLANAAFTNDFVEIFNSGTTTVDFSATPYSVQFLSTAGSTWARTDLTTNSIAAGQYFLIQGASGGGVGTALPAPDAVGSINFTSTTAGKVALVFGTTLLTGNCPGDEGISPFNPINTNIIDFVGYGGTAATSNHCYRGSGPAIFSTTTDQNRRAVVRTLSCINTNSNSVDFNSPANPTGANPPVPRNKNTIIISCP